MSAGDNPPEIADPLIAQLVADRYRVIRKLGEGGMGSVYLAEHVVIEKKFALKVLALELSRRSDLVARFLQCLQSTRGGELLTSDLPIGPVSHLRHTSAPRVRRTVGVFGSLWQNLGANRSTAR